jgi:hypothetical protein
MLNYRLLVTLLYCRHLNATYQLIVSSRQEKDGQRRSSSSSGAAAHRHWRPSLHSIAEASS